MRKMMTILAMALSTFAFGQTTPNMSFNVPTGNIGSAWWGLLNDNFSQLDSILSGNANPLLVNPRVVTGNAAMSATDLVLVVNAAAGASITLPPNCRAGWSRQIVNSSPALLPGSTVVDGIVVVQANPITVTPGGSDVFVAGAAPLGGPGSFPLTLSAGTTTFRAVGNAGTCSGWSWSN
jgi:hypothetical protein